MNIDSNKKCGTDFAGNYLSDNTAEKSPQIVAQFLHGMILAWGGAQAQKKPA